MHSCEAAAARPSHARRHVLAIARTDRYRKMIDGELAALTRLYANKERVFQLLWTFFGAAMVGAFGFISRMAYGFYGDDIIAAFQGFQVE